MKVLIAFLLAAFISPCAAQIVSSPCGTQPPVPANTCASYACPNGLLPKPGTILCGNSQGPQCCKSTCCDRFTTVTTTPYITVTTTPCSTTTPPSCSSFSCPANMKPMPGPRSTTCYGHCSAVQCCNAIITTVTTTPYTTITTTPISCAGFSCPSGMKPKLGSFRVVYPCAAQCCDVVITTVTTTPLATVTTTPLPASCGNFYCDSGMVPGNPSQVCSGTCNADQCCTVLIPTPSSPCAPTYMLYATDDAAATKKSGTLAESEPPVQKPPGHWSLALCSVFGLLACSALASIAVSNRQSSRDIRPVDPRFFCDVDGEEHTYADENHRLLACDIDDIEEGME